MANPKVATIARGTSRDVRVLRKTVSVARRASGGQYTTDATAASIPGQACRALRGQLLD